MRDGGAIKCRDYPGARENSEKGAGLRAFAAEEEGFYGGLDQVSLSASARACAG